MRIALSLALSLSTLAAAPAAQIIDPCRFVATHPVYGPFLKLGSLHCWGHVELVPTGAGVGMMVYSYYPTGGPLLEPPLRNDMFAECPERISVIIYGWWWHDLETRFGDVAMFPDGTETPLIGRDTGYMISPTTFGPFIANAKGVRVRRANYPDRPNPAVCATYSAYLLLPTRGWW